MAASSDPYEGVIGRRVAAWAIDAAILLLLTWLIWGGAVFATLATLGLAGGLMLLPWALIVPILYGTLSLASPLSATPGQAAMGLTVRSDIDGSTPTLGQAFTATTLYALSWASGGVALLAALFSSRGRTLHDLFSGTLVLRAAVLPRRAEQRGYASQDG